MKSTEMITVIPANTDIATNFKDERLARATTRILNIYRQAAKYADEKNREIAKVLSEVMENKAYVKDGFSSVYDYADKVFGISKNNSYSLANAGKVYRDDKAHPELKAMSPSKLAEVARIAPEKLTEALNEGKISSKTTQAELREIAKSLQPTKVKTEVLKEYTIECPPVTPEMIDIMSNKVHKTMQDWDAYFTYLAAMPDGNQDECEVLKLLNGKVTPTAEKATVLRKLYFNKDFSIVVRFFVYNPPTETAPVTTKSKVKSKFTIEELRAMLAEAEMESQEEVVESKKEPSEIKEEVTESNEVQE